MSESSISLHFKGGSGTSAQLQSIYYALSKFAKKNEYVILLFLTIIKDGVMASSWLGGSWVQKRVIDLPSLIASLRHKPVHDSTVACLFLHKKKKPHHVFSKAFSFGGHPLTVKVQRYLIHFYMNLHDLSDEIWNMVISFTPNHDPYRWNSVSIQQE